MRGYFVVVFAMEALCIKELPPLAAAWLPNIVFAAWLRSSYASSGSSRLLVHRPSAMIPGRVLHRFAAVICNAKTLEQVIEPAIADLHKEYHGAAAAHFLRRGWILIAGYCAILKVIAICAVIVAPVRDDERRALRRTPGGLSG